MIVFEAAKLGEEDESPEAIFNQIFEGCNDH